LPSLYHWHAKAAVRASPAVGAPGDTHAGRDIAELRALGVREILHLWVLRMRPRWWCV
jgi:hypothetical protein